MCLNYGSRYIGGRSNAVSPGHEQSHESEEEKDSCAIMSGIADTTSLKIVFLEGIS